MTRIPNIPEVDPIEIVKLLEDRFSALGLKFPDDRLSVNLAWLFDRAANFMRAVERAGNNMNTQEELGEILAELEVQIDSMQHFSNEALPLVHDLLEEL